MNQSELERAILADLFDIASEDDGHFWLTTGDIEVNLWRVETYGFEDEKRELVRIAPFLEITKEEPLGESGGVMFHVQFKHPPRVAYDSDNQPAILELMHRIGALERENARLRAAGLAIAPHTVEEDSISDTLWYGACRVSMRDDEDFIHADDCPTRVFSEGKEE